MAQFNENFTLSTPNPADNRYLSNRISSGRQLPYSGLTEVYTNIPTTVRYSGLTVLVRTGGANVEYWFKDNLTTLIEKKYDSTIPSGDFITGVTNLGFFSGTTGVQRLPIANLNDTATYSGNYDSLYNYYYRGTDSKIHTDYASDGIRRRGYYNLVKNKSWVWNEYTGDASTGWIFVDGNIDNQIGQVLTVYGGAAYTPQFANNTWTTGSYYSNGSAVSIATVTGSLTTGSTLTIGGPSFQAKDGNHLHFRTIRTNTPDLLSVCYDESFVRISGKTATAQNSGTGVGVYIPATTNPLQFRNLIGAGFTTITQSGADIIISSSASGGSGGGSIIGGINGLSTVGTLIKLGGDLTGNTNINGVGTYNLTLSNLNEFSASRSNGTVIGFDSGGILLSQPSGSVTFEDNGGLKYAADYCANYTNRSLVDKEYVQKAISGGTERFTSDLVVNIGAGCSFGRYSNGDTIPANGLTANEVIMLALTQACSPTAALTSTSSSVVFGNPSKSVTLSASYIINTLGSTIVNACIQHYSGSSWHTLSTSTATPNVVLHNIDDSADRFTTSALQYKYVIVDSNNMTGQTTYNVSRGSYSAPTMSISPKGTITGGETQNSRCNGNVISNPSGLTTITNPYVLLTGWALQRSYNSGSYLTLSSGTTAPVSSIAIPSTLDNTVPIASSTISYRLRYTDQYTTNYGGTQTIALAAHPVPAMSVAFCGTLTGGETQSARCYGNVDSCPLGTITVTASCAKITGWELQRCYVGSTYCVLNSATGLLTYSASIPNTCDDTVPIGATGIGYRIKYCDQITSGCSTAQSIAFGAYSVPSFSISLNGTVTPPETQTSRNVGNVISSPSGITTSTNPYVKMTGWKIQRCYDSGSFMTLASGSTAPVSSITIPSTYDGTVPVGASSIGYRIGYTDEDRSGNGSTTTITFLGTPSYYGFSLLEVLDGTQIVALGNGQVLPSQARTMTLTQPDYDYYAYVAYPATFADFTSLFIVGNPYNQISGFSKLTDVNVIIGGVPVAYKVWKANIPGLFDGINVATFA